MELLIVSERKKRQGLLWELLTQTLVVCLIGGTGMFLLSSFFEGQHSWWLFAALSAGTGCIAALLALAGNRLLTGGLLILTALVSSAGFFSGVFVNGMIRVWNRAAQVLGETSAIRLSTYTALSQETASGDELLFWGFATVAACICVFLMVKWRLGILLLAMSAFVPLLTVITGREMLEKGVVLFYCGIFLGEICVISYEKRGQNTAAVPSMLFMNLLFLMGAAAVGSGLWHLAVPVSKYEEPGLLAYVREEGKDALDRIRFQKGEINTLPKGRLDKAGAWKTSKDTALRIEMEEPQSFYLRGFVGSIYTENRWMPLSAETCYENRDLFYWLHEDGFYGNTQLAAARLLVEDDGLAEQVQQIHIENTGADSEFLYTPYELTAVLDGGKDTGICGDDTVRAEGFFGKRSYHILAEGNLVKDFTRLSAQVYLAVKDSMRDSQGRSDAYSYSQKESYYNSFVYENELQIPERLKSLFQKELGPEGDREKGHMDYYSAISHIRSYLEKHMTYSRQTKVVKEGDDFVEDFISQSKIGHSVHFASAAVMMFRYYGIPSRYVEGYLATPETVEKAGASGTMEITGENGHAWTEIYIDGTGWVPVEMTPAFYGVMEEPDLLMGLEATGVRTPQKEEQQEEPEEPKAPENLKKLLQLAVYQLVVLVLWTFLLFDVFCLLFLLWVILRRAGAVLGRKKKFAGKNDRMAVRYMAGYAQELYEHGRKLYAEAPGKREAAFSEKAEALYDQTCRIGEKATFSRHYISGEERALVGQCCKKLLKEIKQSNGWYRKWILKYLEQLY